MTINRRSFERRFIIFISQDPPVGGRTANGRPYGCRIFIDAVILIMEYLE